MDFTPPEATLAHSAGLNTSSVWEHTWKPCLHTMQANTGPWPQVTLEVATSCQVAAFLADIYEEHNETTQTYGSRLNFKDVSSS